MTFNTATFIMTLCAALAMLCFDRQHGRYVKVPGNAFFRCLLSGDEPVNFPQLWTI